MNLPLQKIRVCMKSWKRHSRPVWKAKAYFEPARTWRNPDMRAGLMNQRKSNDCSAQDQKVSALAGSILIKADQDCSGQMIRNAAGGALCSNAMFQHIKQPLAARLRHVAVSLGDRRKNGKNKTRRERILSLPARCSLVAERGFEPRTFGL